jgi:hypothetical protein
MTRTPLPASTSSNAAVNLLSRSLTRSNDRRLTTSSGRDWGKNGDAWLVTRLTAGMPPPQPATR